MVRRGHKNTLSKSRHVSILSVSVTVGPNWQAQLNSLLAANVRRPTDDVGLELINLHLSIVTFNFLYLMNEY